jgi:hypothetical protein
MIFRGVVTKIFVGFLRSRRGKKKDKKPKKKDGTNLDGKDEKSDG